MLEVAMPNTLKHRKFFTMKQRLHSDTLGYIWHVTSQICQEIVEHALVLRGIHNKASTNSKTIIDHKFAALQACRPCRCFETSKHEEQWLLLLQFNALQMVGDVDDVVRAVRGSTAEGCCCNDETKCSKTAIARVTSF